MALGTPEAVQYRVVPLLTLDNPVPQPGHKWAPGPGRWNPAENATRWFPSRCGKGRDGCHKQGNVQVPAQVKSQAHSLAASQDPGPSVPLSPTPRRMPCLQGRSAPHAGSHQARYLHVSHLGLARAAHSALPLPSLANSYSSFRTSQCLALKNPPSGNIDQQERLRPARAGAVESPWPGAFSSQRKDTGKQNDLGGHRPPKEGVLRTGTGRAAGRCRVVALTHLQKLTTSPRRDVG